MFCFFKVEENTGLVFLDSVILDTFHSGDFRCFGVVEAMTFTLPSGGIGGGSPLPDMEAMEMRNYDNNGNAKQSATKRKACQCIERIS